MKSFFPRVLAGCTIILMLILACNFSTVTRSAGNPPPSPTEANPDTASTETPSQTAAWSSATLTLRSVTLELSTTYAGEKPKTVSAQIDAAGNLHLRMSMPPLEAFAAMPGISQPGDFELFIIDGTAYARIGQDNPPVQDDSSKSMLEDLLLGPEGPGLWLDLVPENGFIKTGTQSYEGFNVSTYKVNYQNEQGTLTGTIRVADKSEALVSAELTVSKGLFFPPGFNPSGDVQISLKVQQAEISPISLP